MTEQLFKILAVCIIAAAICIILKPKSGEYALFVTLGAGALIFTVIFKNIFSTFSEVEKMLSAYGVEAEYFKVALKALGIGYITSFAADSCRDAGQSALASKAELAGKCAVWMLSLPLVVSVLKIAVGFIK